MLACMLSTARFLFFQESPVMHIDEVWCVNEFVCQRVLVPKSPRSPQKSPISPQKSNISLPKGPAVLKTRPSMHVDEVWCDQEMWCSMLQCVADEVLPCATDVFVCVVVCCSVLQCVAVSCRVLQCVAHEMPLTWCSVLHGIECVVHQTHWCWANKRYFAICIEAQINIFV